MEDEKKLIAAIPALQAEFGLSRTIWSRVLDRDEIPMVRIGTVRFVTRRDLRAYIERKRAALVAA